MQNLFIYGNIILGLVNKKIKIEQNRLYESELNQKIMKIIKKKEICKKEESVCSKIEMMRECNWLKN